MSDSRFAAPTRRGFIAGTASLLAAPAYAQRLVGEQNVLESEREANPNVRRNISSFSAQDWRPYFSSLRNGAILVDIDSRALHYWGPDQVTYRLYPSSIPISEELTRRGRTSVIQKVVGPDWRPTPNMLKRNPEWPRYIPPGPDNPLGTHALYLSWTYYRIHGTHDNRKIGRKSSNGCIGLYNAHIQDLFALAQVGTQVRVI
ncbi:L,D-transpeptidase [Sulfitobacter sp. D35]|uniref:L,D-transpeptidase n=1 Tax=Sulfitobacter sp. D35 TaxID=3083252 RepID=UPI00296ED829|nr:L,D-transpeptidase [Sulfitobacter sp. D35]MDW4498039.1 L,D-transpeptidase [Sulfitobacter sp. D35]